jgi:hypothetical protein
MSRDPSVCSVTYTLLLNHNRSGALRMTEGTYDLDLPVLQLHTSLRGFKTAN